MVGVGRTVHRPLTARSWLSMTKRFRPMKPDRSVPQLKRSLSGLGVRPGVDIVPDEDDEVRPGTGGMSVTPEDVELMPRDLRPE